MKTRSVGVHPLAVAYVIVAGAGTAVVGSALVAGAMPLWSLLIWAVYFGPLGLALLVVAWTFQGVIGLVVSSAVAGRGPDTGLLVAVVVTAVVLCTGVAVVNAVVVTRVQRRARADREAGLRSDFAGRLPFVWDRLVGASGFVLAGAAFVLLSAVDGFFALTAGGIDVPTPAAIAATTRLLAGVGWLAGLIAAVAGLVLWIVTWYRGRPSTRWAVGDLVAQIVLIAVPITYATVTGV